jgi:uncharacterized membrane protein YfcA
MTEIAGALVALVLAAVTAPAGVSGAVLLLPVQVSLLGVPSPAVTPTNLLYNVVATPGALLRYARDGSLRTRLAVVLLAGSLPGVVVGAVLRVTVLDDPAVFLVVVSGVLLPLGTWLLLGRRHPTPKTAATRLPRWLPGLALAVGVVGGVYGIGGGSVLAPVLLALGFSVRRVAGAALLATFATSIAGIATYGVLSVVEPGADTIDPDWSLGLALGAGGLVGSYLGAWLQPYVPEAALRRLLGALAVLIALRYAWTALG